jgi:hypothetical protein
LKHRNVAIKSEQSVRLKLWVKIKQY